MKKSLKMRNPKYPLLPPQNKFVKNLFESKEGTDKIRSFFFSETL